jgi:D-glycerate 3-kinase
VKEELERVHDIPTIVLSLDDLYLARREQEKLDGCRNRLLRGRGLPGTHDLDLAEQLYDSLSTINDTREIRLPVYDKSAHNGLGDRAGFSTLVIPSDRVLQLVIFEGWMVGFVPLDPAQLRNTYHHLLQLDPASTAFTTKFSLDELLEINRNLSAYVQRIWRRIDLLINLVPQDLNSIWRWRIQVLHLFFFSSPHPPISFLLGRLAIL